MHIEQAQAGLTKADCFCSFQGWLQAPTLKTVAVRGIVDPGDMNVVLSVLGGAAAVEFKRHFDKDKEKQRRAKGVEQKEQELERREQQLKAAQVFGPQKILQLHRLPQS